MQIRPWNVFFDKINASRKVVELTLRVGQRITLTDLAESYVENIVTAIGLLRTIKVP